MQEYLLLALILIAAVSFNVMSQRALRGIPENDSEGIQQLRPIMPEEYIEPKPTEPEVQSDRAFYLPDPLPFAGLQTMEEAGLTKHFEKEIALVQN